MKDLFHVAVGGGGCLLRSQITVQGARYPENLQRMTGR